MSDALTCARCGHVSAHTDDVHTCSPRRDALADLKRLVARNLMLSTTAAQYQMEVDAEARVRAVIDAARAVVKWTEGMSSADYPYQIDLLDNALSAFDGKVTP